MRRIIYKIFYPIIYWFLSTFRRDSPAAICVIECDESILFIRNTYGTMSWTFPGGRLKKHEAPEAAVRREIKEEVGIVLSELLLVGQIFGRRRGPPHSPVYCFYSKIEKPRTMIDRGEILDARWFAKGDMPEPLSIIVPQIIGLFEQKNPPFSSR